MARVALDTSILIYAELEPETAKGRRASEMILRSAHDGVISAQVLGEFVRFIQRKAPGALLNAMRQVNLYRAIFLVPPTTDEIIASAAEAVRQQQMQFWDCVILAAAAGGGAKAMLTEDIQDGHLINGVRLLNPFVAGNAAAIDALIEP